MVHHGDDNLLTTTFTPRDYQVELFEAAKEHNIIVCLGTGSGKTFIAAMLIREKAHEVTNPVAQGGKRTIFLANTVPLVRQQAAYLRNHTPLRVKAYTGEQGVDLWKKDRWTKEFDEQQVLVMTTQIFLDVLHFRYWNMKQVNVLVLDECHHAIKDSPMKQVLGFMDQCSARDSPRILGLTASLINANCKPIQLGRKIEQLESTLRARAQTAADIVGMLCYSTQPKEMIVECTSEPSISEIAQKLEQEILSMTGQMILFMQNHRFDPIEIYGDEEYCRNIPNPTKEPLEVLREFEFLVETFGIWGADRAALVSLIQLEKLKTRTAYERHYLLLCLVFTLMLQIRAKCDEIFQLVSEPDRILHFTKPKILRLLSILHKYQPVQPASPSMGETPRDEEQEKDVKREENVEEKTVNLPARGSSYMTRRKRDHFVQRYNRHMVDANALCGLIFVERRSTAKLLYHLLKDASRYMADLAFVNPLYIVGRQGNPLCDSKELELETKKQEEVLKRFRTGECNVLVSTSVLEEGIDVPACHLVVRYDLPKTYRAYVQSRGRARAKLAHYILMVEDDCMGTFLDNLAQFHAIEQMLLRKCHSKEPPTEEHQIADELADVIAPYMPDGVDGARATLLNAVALVNRYCAKLPSDSFTRLVPSWTVEQISTLDLDEETKVLLNKIRRVLRKPIDSFETPGYVFKCSLFLPINSPLREEIHGYVMPTKVLAQRSVALETCKRLHAIKELDDHLLPVGKENMDIEGEEEEDFEEENVPEGSARPGTTKRRQYYYKQVAECFTNCQPVAGQPLYLYALKMELTEPIPEEQNTRGRKIFQPELATQSFGILTSKPIPKICSFPIFTRSGEVEVTLVEIQRQLVVDQTLLTNMKHFQHYVFQNVLMLEKNPMVFNVGASPCSYLVVPLRQNAKGYLSLDKKFAEKIALQRNYKPRFLMDEERKNFQFVPEAYQDTVVMRWYREQEHPQCFYVAEICWNLNPQSKFPDHKYNTFEEYYKDKYGIQIQDLKQPLLDVDHSSSRLNFLTPRYMNRKGMILPTSSEETKRAKRESLQQKQILVPELCCIHPFTASLWRQAVCLPCVLYRLNGLLISESLRLLVANEIGLGKTELSLDFEWGPLRFGWKKKAALLKSDSMVAANSNKSAFPLKAITASNDLPDTKPKPVETLPPRKESSQREKGTGKKKEGYSIGVWSADIETMNGNSSSATANEEDVYDLRDLKNVTMLGLGETSSETLLSNGWGESMDTTNGHSDDEPNFRAGSPDYLRGFDDYYNGSTNKAPSDYYGSDYEGDSSSYEDDNSANDEDDDEDGEDNDDDDGEGNNNREFGPKLVFKGDTAEAVEDKPVKQRALEEMVDELQENEDEMDLDWEDQLLTVRPADIAKYHSLIEAHKKQLRDQVIHGTDNVEINRGSAAPPTTTPNRGNAQDRLLSVLNSDAERHQLASASPFTAQLTEILIKPPLSPANFNKSCTAMEIADDEKPAVPSSGQPWNIEHLNDNGEMVECSELDSDDPRSTFSFDEQPDLATHPGPSPSILLQAFTMSNANDGINLERLETIGDSFLKYAITTYLYCQYTSIHEGKLSHLRSKKVSNLQLYRLGKRKRLGEWMIASKFNPHDNWLPPGYVIPRNLEEALIESGVHASFWNVADFEGLQDVSAEEVRPYVMKIAEKIKSRFPEVDAATSVTNFPPGHSANDALVSGIANFYGGSDDEEQAQRFVPYNLLTQHSVPDKSIADCAEALIGAYLTACGPRGALLFMSWLGIRVLPLKKAKEGEVLQGMDAYGTWTPPLSPIIARLPNSELILSQLLTNFDVFEERIQYRFKERSYLLQAFTHASYYPNRLTDCYQRLEFLGDAVLDYLITRYLYEDPRQHPPGALTDLRSALVNNTTFAVLAVRYGFHNYFKHFSYALDSVLENFIKKQEENGHQINDEYFIEEDESEGAEDVEVPKALGDVFESVAGAIYLDSGLSLDAVWKVYYRIMRKEIEEFSKNVPKSPVRELLELENDRVKFGKAEKIADGRVRVAVEVIGKGTFKGIGRNYRIAKCTAAKYALRTLEKHKLLAKRDES